MGSDGWIVLYDRDRIDSDGLRDKFHKSFEYVYSRTINGVQMQSNGVNIYTVYGDTEGHNMGTYPEFDKYIIDEWEVWTWLL